ncbi:hypothetical protein V8C34DRAFT_269340 [Trichoderma compactum]
MPQYRIEISPNNRAGCNDTVCKKQGAKIFKNEIRLGTWVEIQDRGSWKWKHWGCVSGSQIAGLQESCGGDPDNYDFNAIDGFDELNDEDIKEKIRRCVKQGHIDAEDFKGDPEKNKLGEKGIYLSAKEKAAKEKAAAKDAGEDEAAPAKANKRGGKKAADVADEPKVKRAKKSKSVEADEEPPKAKSKAKAKAKDVTEEDAGESASAKRGRPRRSITQQDEEVGGGEAEASAPAKKATKKGLKAKAAQEQQPEEETVEEDEVEEKEKEKATPARAARGRKTAASKAKTATTYKDEAATPASAPRGRKRAAAAKTDDAEEDEPKPLVKKGRKSSTPAKKFAPEPTEDVEAEVDTPKAAPKAKGRGRPRRSDASTA